MTSLPLFPKIGSSDNLLPYDGQVLYHGLMLTEAEQLTYMEALMNTIPWQHDITRIYGKEIMTKRKVAWYGDKPFHYTYSHMTKDALSWTPELLRLKTQVEQVTGESYNSCLLNLYHSGEEGVSWHSDGEKELRKNGSIASVSLGAARPFDFKHKTSKEKIRVWLDAGSLLEMKGSTQTHWWHSLPKTKKVTQPRINLTFRQMEQDIK